MTAHSIRLLLMIATLSYSPTPASQSNQVLEEAQPYLYSVSLTQVLENRSAFVNLPAKLLIGDVFEVVGFIIV